MDDLLMGIRDAQRLGPLKAALEGRITNAKGAELTGLSLRQFKRLKQRLRRRGAAGLLHGNRGRPSPRRLAPQLREQVTRLLQHPEARLNDCHVRDVLAERGVTISAESVRQIRRGLGLAPKRRRRPPRHHRRRLRAARRGSMVLIDGTEFAWLGTHQPPFTLVGTLDDATGELLSVVRRPNEDLHGFTQALRDLVTTFGVPEALYGDRTGIAVRNDGHWSREEELTGRQRPTQFGQMLEELGIQYIVAHSPEAKGRIERHWQMLQDRLPAELALHGIRTLDAFDAFLPPFLARCHDWFAQAPRETVSAWRAAPRHLDRILACRYTRVVGQDNVVSIPGHTLQLPPGPHQRSYARARVEVRELLDGRLMVLRDDRILIEQPAPSTPFTLVPRESASAPRRPRRKLLLRSLVRIDDRSDARLPPPLPAGDRAALVRDRRRPTTQHPWKRNPYKPQRQPHPAAGG
jgi:transposase